MDLVWVVLGIAAVAVLLFFVATAVFGPGERPEQASTERGTHLPVDRDLTADDLRALELPVVARGYRMSDVDALIERMARQLGHDLGSERRDLSSEHGDLPSERFGALQPDGDAREARPSDPA
ncbi:DivIVA domain-containing protein [Cumulibacter soli]|uniref:DivIVA domain-containing protein n=1 Tax=Cumulibacter soli TaxID=2546344 RepID=UPI0010688D3D|nr:DivIVA domain-containing protein [Cumulibacter soli]